jgi:hypothetical protein
MGQPQAEFGLECMRNGVRQTCTVYSRHSRVLPDPSLRGGVSFRFFQSLTTARQHQTHLAPNDAVRFY